MEGNTDEAGTVLCAADEDWNDNGAAPLLAAENENAGGVVLVPAPSQVCLLAGVPPVAGPARDDPAGVH